MAGEANDAVSVQAKVKMEDATKLQKLLETECPIIWTKLPRYRRSAEWDKIDDPVVLLESKIYSHPVGKITVGTQTGMITAPRNLVNK